MKKTKTKTPSHYSVNIPPEKIERMRKLSEGDNPLLLLNLQLEIALRTLRDDRKLSPEEEQQILNDIAEARPDLKDTIEVYQYLRGATDVCPNTPPGICHSFSDDWPRREE